jgi:hypothetical protein
MSLDSAAAGYDDTVFISYTHVDNEPFGPDELHWITYLHEQLTSRLEQLSSDRVTVWRDEKLQGNDVFAETLTDRLSNVAVLVSVCSPRYLHSEWCQRELDEFLHAAEGGSGVQVGTKSRVFKVLKTPVPLDELPEPLTPLLGYEFYEESPGESRIREFLLNPSPEERWKFYARVDDLAQDIAALLEDLPNDGPSGVTEASAEGRTVYLAEATSDVAPHRDNVKRELERRGHRVLPQRALPLAVEELTAAVNADLARSELSIHLLGARYGTRPEGEDRSIPHLQVDLAGKAASRDGLVQLIWIPDELNSDNETQAALIEGLQAADVGAGVEVIRAPLESFKAHALNRIAPPPPPPVAPEVKGEAKRVYLVYERDDREPAAILQKQLEALGHVVMLPLSEGAETEAREVHESSMVLSDAVLIYYGNATEHWVRMKLFDLVKAPGWGRTEPFQAKAVWVAAPATPHKETYATNEALVLDATSNPGPSALEPFLTQLASATTGQ